MPSSGESYTLSLLLELKDRASSGLRAFTRQLEPFRAGNHVYDSKNIIKNLSTVSMHAMQVGREIGDVWKRRAESLDVYTEASRRLLTAQQKFVAINLSPQENAEAFSAVAKTVKEVQGISLKDATEQITDLHTALGDLHHAIEAMPMAAQYRTSFETLFGDKFTGTQIEEQIRSAMKYLEVTGAVTKGRGEMEKRFNIIAQMTTATGGRLTGEELLQMARKGGPSVQGLTPTGLRNLSGPLQELGGAGTGTALMSMYQALVGGTMRQSSAAEFQRLGLIDPKKITFGKAGQIKRLNVGANLLGDTMQQDPLAAADQLMAAMSKHGINTKDDDAVRKELAVLFQNRRSQMMMALLTTQRPQVAKEAGLAEHAKDIPGMYKQAQDSPLFAQQRYEKAMEDFRAKVGLPLLQVGAQLGTSLLPVLSWLADHPDLAAGLIGTKLALGGIVESSFMLRSSGLLNFLSNTATGGQAAASGLQAAAQQATGLQRTTGMLRGFARSPITISIAMIATGIAVEKVISALDELKRREQEAREAGDNTRQYYDSMVSSGRGPGGRADKQTLEQLTDLTFGQIKGGDELAKSLMPERQDFWEPFFSGKQRFRGSYWDINEPLGGQVGWEGGHPRLGPRSYDVASAARTIRGSQAAVGLADPRVMGGVIRRTWASDFTQDAQNKFFETLKAVNPESYAAGMKLAQDEVRAMGEKTLQTVTGLNMFGQAITPLPGQFGRVGDAAQGLSFRLNAAALDFHPGEAINNFFNNLRPPDYKPVAPLPSGGVQFGDKPSLLNPPVLRPGAPRFSFNMGVPRRAIGGIVERDGLAHVHAGNIIQPARITRGLSSSLTPQGIAAGVIRQLTELRAPRHRLQLVRADAPSTRAPVGPPAAVPGRAIGGIVEREGTAYLHAGNIIQPAQITRGLSASLTPQGITRGVIEHLTEQRRDAPLVERISSSVIKQTARGATDERESAGRAQLAPPRFTTGPITVNVNLPPGAPAATDPEELVAVITRRLQIEMERGAGGFNE